MEKAAEDTVQQPRRQGRDPGSGPHRQHEGSVTRSRLSRVLNWTRSFLPAPSAQGTKPLWRPVDGWSLAAVMLPPVIDTALAHFEPGDVIGLLP